MMEERPDLVVLDIMLKPIDVARDTPRLRKILARLPDSRAAVRYPIVRR
ncbi:MAG: hypothetical protein IT529_13135 [Burkholderiales bacterium]|nr:hypothetical protein [Burkholderiales bacterium]